jgi:hypothetical protein
MTGINGSDIQALQFLGASLRSRDIIHNRIKPGLFGAFKQVAGKQITAGGQNADRAARGSLTEESYHTVVL